MKRTKKKKTLNLRIIMMFKIVYLYIEYKANGDGGWNHASYLWKINNYNNTNT